MAEVKCEYIAVNELKASAKDAKKMMFEGQNIRIAWAEGKRVWDVWEAKLSASNFSVPSTTTTLTKALLNLKSYGTDKLGAKHDMEYTISPTSISANTSTSSRTQSVTIRQTKTDKSIIVTATQAGRVAQSTTYGTPSVTSTSISTVPASGKVTRYLTVYWSQTKTTTYDNGTTSYTTVTGSSTANITSGSANNSSGAYISGGGVYVPSAGTTYYTSQRTAYTISHFTYTANGVNSGTVQRTVYVYQDANTRSIQYKNYSVSLYTNTTNVGAYNDSVSITAYGSKELHYVYASGSSEYSSTENSSVTLSSSYGQFYRNGSYVTSTTVSSGTQVTFMPYENESSSGRTITVVGKNYDSTTTSYTLTLAQSAAEYYLEIKGTNTIVSNGGTLNWVIVSTRNGKLCELTKSNISVGSGATIQSFTYNDVLGDRYNLVLSVSENTNTSAKYITITVEQPNGETASSIITQAASSGSTTPTITTEIDAYFEDTYTVFFEVYIYTSDNYINENVIIKVQDTADKYGKEYGRFEYPSPVDYGAHLINTINIFDNVWPMYLAVWVGDKFIDARIIQG